MSEFPDWTVWLLAVAVIVLFGVYFWHTGRALLSGLVTLIRAIENWPQRRRAMVEAEAKAGGRYPLWYRAVRVFLVVAMILLVAFLVFRRVA